MQSRRHTRTASSASPSSIPPLTSSAISTGSTKLALRALHSVASAPPLAQPSSRFPSVYVWAYTTVSATARMRSGRGTARSDKVVS